MSAVRARHLKTKLDLLSRWPGGSGVLARIDPGIVQAVERAHGTDWLPVEHDVEITHAAHDALGPESADRLWTEMLLAELDGPLFGPVARTVQAAPDGAHDRWAETLCKAWPLAFQDCGRWKVQRTGPRSVDLRLGDLPESCAGSHVWLASVASALSAVHRYLRAEGTFQLCQVDPPRGALYRSSWDPAPVPSGRP